MHRCFISAGRDRSAHQGKARRRRLIGAAATAALAAVSLGGAYASAANVTDTWLTATNGTWTDPTKWSAAVSPTNGADTYSVVIGATGSPYTITLNTSATVNDFTLNSPNAT